MENNTERAKSMLSEAGDIAARVSAKAKMLARRTSLRRADVDDGMMDDVNSLSTIFGSIKRLLD